MTTPEDPALSGAAQDAAAWHARLASDDATEQDFLEFEQWLADPLNRATFDRIEAALLDLEADPQAARRALSGPDAAPAAGNVTPLRPRRRPAMVVGAWIGAAAAAVAAVFVALTVLDPSDYGRTDYVAAPDSDRVFALPDGSSIHLNRGAAVTVDWRRDERRITLTRGEASFDVRHDSGRPFVVQVGDDEIRDLGTEFNVLSTRDALEVTVREGAVQVTTPLASEPQDLQAGTAITIDRAAGSVAVESVDPDAAFAWTAGRLVYDNATLAEVAADIARYGAAPVTFAEPDLAALTFSGVLEIDDAGMMAERLAGFMGLRADVNGDGIRFSRAQ